MPSYSPRQGSVIRDFMLWLFDVPYGEPYISCTIDIRWDAARAYLERLNRAAAPRVTTHHLFTAAVGKLFVEFPSINARIHHNRIYPLPSVDVAMPVHREEDDRELSMIIVRDVGALGPRGVAEAMVPQMKAERTGKPTDPLLGLIVDAGKQSPRVLRVALRALATATHDPRTAALLHRRFPVSTLITNVGAAISKSPGVRFRAVAFSPPEKLVHMGSIFGLGPIEDAPVVEGGAVVVAPVLPVVFIFDHRLIDGVQAGRLMARLGEMLLDPGRTWPDA